MTTPTLDLDADLTELTRALCDIESVSGNERAIADAVETALRRFEHLEVVRDGDAVLARTSLGRASRVLLAGHLDTVPVANNLPVVLEESGEEARLIGRGTCDMKGGVAVLLQLAARAREPEQDVTYIFYDHEEVESERNGLGRIAHNLPGWLAADFAILGEPTAAAVEGGCKGTLRVRIRATGRAAHSARDWMGHNAIHDLSGVLERLAAHRSETITVDGLEYRECLNAVRVEGGIAGNVIPDAAFVDVNYRFAPHRDAAAAIELVTSIFADLPVSLEVTDCSAGARPGLDSPAAAAFVEAMSTGDDPILIRAKQGWTDVARFSELGIPAVNFGPADPLLAHADDEFVAVSDIYRCAAALGRWLQP